MLKKVLLFDESYLMYKSYFGMHDKHLKTEISGEEIITSTIFGFLRELIMIKERSDYQAFIVCADSPPYIKKQRYKTYKEKRGSKAKIPSFAYERDILEAILYDLRIPVVHARGFEAEEVAKVVLKGNAHVESMDLYSSDEDCYCLLSNKTSLVKSVKGNLEYFMVEDLRYKYGVTPRQFVSWKCLTGCSSDEVEGINGCGKKYASILVSKFGSLDGIYESLGEIDKMGKKFSKIASSLRSVKDSGELEKIKFLICMGHPKKLEIKVPEEKLNFEEILEVIEARTFLKGRPLRFLKNIKKENPFYLKELRLIPKFNE